MSHMNKLAACLFLLCAGIVANAQVSRPAATPTPSDSDDVVKISTSLIQVDVTVTDSKGNIVTGLKREDFEIYENGERQDISNFAFVSDASSQKVAAAGQDPNIPAPPTPVRSANIRRTFALVVDDLLMSFESSYHTRRALRTFVDKQMQEGDLVAIIRTAGGIGALQQFTTDKRQLYAAIERLKWNPGGRAGFGAFAPVEPTMSELAKASGDTTVSDEDIQQEKNSNRSAEEFRDSLFATSMLAALKFIVRGMGELPGRKSVIMFSDGFSLLQVDPQGFTESGRVMSSLTNVIDEASRSSVVIYTIDARGLQTTNISAEDKIINLSPQAMQQISNSRGALLHETQGGLDYLADETGGLSIKNVNRLDDGVARVLKDQSYYLIGYEPNSETFDAAKRRFNKLEIKVNRPGVTVRYRSGFFNVPESADRTRIVDGKLTPVQQLQAALSSPFAVNEITLSLNTIFGNAPSGSYARSLLHVAGDDLTFVDEKDGTKKVVFEVLAGSFGDNGLPVDQIGKTYTVNVSAVGYEKIRRDGFVYHFEFPLKAPGGYQYRVAIRDTVSGRVGSASTFIEVPDLKKSRLTVSSLVVQNFTAAQWAKLSSGVSIGANESPSNPMDDTANRRFKAGTVLQYGFEIYKARLGPGNKPLLSVKTRVFRDGKLVLDGQPIPIDMTQQGDMDRVKAGGAINLIDKMPAGEYVLQVVVTDEIPNKKSRIATQYVPFEIVP